VRKKLAEHGKTIDDAATFYLDYLERIRRCKVTVAELSLEIIEAKRKDGMSATYIADLKKRLARFCADFGERSIAGVTRQLASCASRLSEKPGKLPRKRWRIIQLRNASPDAR
jgi:hypothetical protein